MATEARPAEYSIDAKWDTAVDTYVRRSIYGALAGGVVALVLLRAPTARATALGLGVGFGAGTAYADTKSLFADAIKGPQQS